MIAKPALGVRYVATWPKGRPAMRLVGTAVELRNVGERPSVVMEFEQRPGKRTRHTVIIANATIRRARPDEPDGMAARVPVEATPRRTPRKGG